MRFQEFAHQALVGIAGLRDDDKEPCERDGSSNSFIEGCEAHQRRESADTQRLRYLRCITEELLAR